MELVENIRDTQNLMLPVMVFIDKICRDHNLRYSLAYGTLIGAIRHKGFIPWDDDIDIIMPRPDYEKLQNIIKNMNSDEFGIMDSNDLDSFYVTRMAKVYNKKTYLKEFPHKYILEYGAFVDIFAVNGMPDDVEEIKKMEKDIFWCSRCLHMYISSIYRIRGKRKKFTWFFKPFAKWALNKSNKIFNRYDFDSSKYAMNFEGDSIEKELIETDLFNHLIDVDFEGYKFKVFEQYDSYLKQMYGDYMQLPPIEEQEPHHSFDLYKI